MGRGGGSSHGGGRSSGGGFSSRSHSGGWGGSSHGRGGGRSSSGSRSSFGGSSYRSGGYYHRSGYGGCLFTLINWMFSKIITTIAFFVIVYIIISLLSSRSSSSISSTIQREKLDSSTLKLSANWIEDNAKWLSNESTVINKMKYFLDKTGVQPYLIINDDINGEKTKDEDKITAYLDKKYDELFDDEAHMILLFYEPYEDDYGRFMIVGTAGATVMDQEAQSIMYKYIDKYYTASMSDDEYFSTIFFKTADTIMQKVTTKADVAKTGIIGFVVVILVMGAIVFIVVRRKQKIKEKEVNAKILNSNLADSIPKSPDDISLEEKYKN